MQNLMKQNPNWNSDLFLKLQLNHMNSSFWVERNLLDHKIEVIFLRYYNFRGEEMAAKGVLYIRKHNNKISHQSTYQIYVLLSGHCLCIVTIGNPSSF